MHRLACARFLLSIEQDPQQIATCIAQRKQDNRLTTGGLTGCVFHALQCRTLN